MDCVEKKMKIFRIEIVVGLFTAKPHTIWEMLCPLRPVNTHVNAMTLSA